MVCPPTRRAATPVGATTTRFFLSFSGMMWINVDFPVPAEPVTKRTGGGWLAKRSKTAFNSGVI